RPVSGAVIALPVSVLLEYVLETAVLLIARAFKGGTVPAHLEEAAIPTGQVPLRVRVLHQVVEFHDSPTSLLIHDRLVGPWRDDPHLLAGGFPDFHDVEPVRRSLRGGFESPLHNTARLTPPLLWGFPTPNCPAEDQQERSHRHCLDVIDGDPLCPGRAGE